MQLGELTLNLTEQTVLRAEQGITLNATAFKILLVLAQAHPQPVSRSMLIHKIWGDEPPDSNALKSHIYNLRNAIDKNFAFPMVKTITNIGYKLMLET